uniref:L-gulonolactone oxidase n=1 Tax=Candidatus Kentrum sp. LPFa TaxID=2126335 RepID=A0A450WUN7_9GAMM|nr:MAG: L-gulonolactone oxidase [Candidatus Kentron sp. LPFa]
MSNTWISWNKNTTHEVVNFYTPDREEMIIESVKKSDSIRVVGSGQSSADIAAGSTDLISLDEYNGFVQINSPKYEITVEAGMKLSKLLTEIDKFGWTLPALPDIDTVTVGGALSTGTHGTGHSALPLSGYVVECRLILADGSIETITEDNPSLEAVRFSLGLLGILSTVTFRCEPQWKLQLDERPVKDAHWLSSYPTWLHAHKLLRILWLPHTGFGYVITGDEAKYGAERGRISWYVKYRRKISAMLYKWTVPFPGFTVTANKIIRKLFFNHHQSSFGTLYETTVTKSRGSTLELAEWTVAFDRFGACFADLKETLNSKENRAFAHIPMDIRFLDADKTWLSYGYDRPCVTIGCVSRTPKHADKYVAFTVIEEVFRRHGGRPHWAKRHTMAGDEFGKLYPRWDDFLKVRKKLDPNGKFLTPYFTKLLGL